MKDLNNNYECYVVLGHLMDADGILGDESKSRVLKLINLIKNKSNQLIFFCGWDYRADSSIKIASALSIFFKENCKESHNIFLSDLSRDTVGDAIFLRKFFNLEIGIKKINVITSNYHCFRADMIFNYVFSDNKIELHEANIKNVENKATHEKNSYQAFLKTFEDIGRGDIEKIYQALINTHPYYNGEIYEKME
tara:strand:+ start:452 stop:1033 length:582 start_codon:yes stop_codon:yes gene_type:complete